MNICSKFEATVNNPCNGELTCLTEIQPVRLVGCVRIMANTGPILSFLSIEGGEIYAKTP
ncbi:hypothetical protein ERL59_14825 [Chengkuizengella sp. YPA3-1-1]|uniref:Uncharacterized protein n=1 Tax=Chengkuizengella marina TaxID=2507566 RepID=A0A6N9Q699_9BACL|nr:hypothetical protein [Chengkuizengella marina]